MGYFCLPNGEEPEDDIEGAIANIELYLQSEDCKYLLDTFALPMLKSAIEKLKDGRRI